MDTPNYHIIAWGTALNQPYSSCGLGLGNTGRYGRNSPKSGFKVPFSPRQPSICSCPMGTMPAQHYSKAVTLRPSRAVGGYSLVPGASACKAFFMTAQKITDVCWSKKKKRCTHNNAIWMCRALLFFRINNAFLIRGLYPYSSSRRPKYKPTTAPLYLFIGHFNSTQPSTRRFP